MQQRIHVIITRPLISTHVEAHGKLMKFELKKEHTVTISWST